MSNPEVCVLKTDGTNCDMETAHAFDIAGANSEIVHVNELRSGDRKLADFGVLAIQGGFSYGDDIASGKVLANELTSYLSDQLREFTEREKAVIGICNGFQVLVRTGLLPAGQLGEQTMSLAYNDSGHFECRWVELTVGESVCRFAQPEDFPEVTVPMQVAHAEGRFVGRGMELLQLDENNQIVFRYALPNGQPADGHYPHNPNGSELDIAGICDATGTVLGMMPHPERSIETFHPHRESTEYARFAANAIFRNIVEYSRAM